MMNHIENKRLFMLIQKNPAMMTKVLRLRASGFRNKEIALKLGITENCVAQHIHQAKKRYA